MQIATCQQQADNIDNLQQVWLVCSRVYDHGSWIEEDVFLSQVGRVEV